jgi:hypothetical protein
MSFVLATVTGPEARRVSFYYDEHFHNVKRFYATISIFLFGPFDRPVEAREK